MSDCDRVPTHERLLSREQIDALDDLESLLDLQDDVMATAKRIEVDLEFRSDDEADDGWEHRARGALTAHHICNGHLSRRIAYIRRGSKPAPSPAKEQTKAERKTAEALLVAAQVEHKRLKAAEDREKTARMLVTFASRQSLLLHFHKAAGEHLDNPTMGCS